MDSIQIVFLFVVISSVIMFALTTLFFFEKNPIYVIGLIFGLYLLGCLPIVSSTAADISVYLMVFTLCLSLSYILGVKQFGVQGATNVSPLIFYVQSLIRCAAVGLIAFFSLNFIYIQQPFKWLRVYLQKGESMRCILVLIIVGILFSLVTGVHYTHGILFVSGIVWCRIRQVVHLEEAGN